MIMKRIYSFIIFLILIVSFSQFLGCEEQEPVTIALKESEPVVEPTPEIEESEPVEVQIEESEPEAITEVQESEPCIPISEPEIIEEQEEIEVINAIPCFANYFATGDGSSKSKKIYGIKENTNDQEPQKLDIVEIKIVDEEEKLFVSEFFKKGNDLFIVIRKYDDEQNEAFEYYKQSGETVEIIESMPVKPDLSRSQLESNEWRISDFEYKGVDYSDIRKKTYDLKGELVLSGINRFKMVDGFIEFPNIGLAFNVKEGRFNDDVVIADSGLYFWPYDKPAPSRFKESGDVW